MTSSILIAAMGFASTLAAVFMTAYFQRRAAVQGKLMESKIQAYGDCAEALFEYHRATFNRVKARLEERPDRDELRQEAYRSNSRARSAIGRIAILSKEADLRHSLSAIRESIGDLNKASRRRGPEGSKQIDLAWPDPSVRSGPR